MVTVESTQDTSEAIAAEWRRTRTPEEVQRQVQLCRLRHDWSAVAAEMETVFGLPRRRRGNMPKSQVNLQFRKVK